VRLFDDIVDQRRKDILIVAFFVALVGVVIMNETAYLFLSLLEKPFFEDLDAVAIDFSVVGFRYANGGPGNQDDKNGQSG
jgi:hypothetical protein